MARHLFDDRLVPIPLYPPPFTRFLTVCETTTTTTTSLPFPPSFFLLVSKFLPPPPPLPRSFHFFPLFPLPENSSKGIDRRKRKRKRE